MERTFGIWKRRFPCLSRGLLTKLVCSSAFIVPCVVLHNMSLIFKDLLLVCEDLFADDEKVPLPAPHKPRNLNGFAVCEALIVRLVN